MTRVSKKKLSKDARKKLLTQFVYLFSSTTKDKQGDLFTALFTDAEETMFIKRVAMIFLLLEGYSTYRISKTLIVSDSTVRSIQKRCESGSYDPIIQQMRKKSFDREKFWNTIDKVLRCGMPPRVGSGRWKWLYEMTD